MISEKARQPPTQSEPQQQSAATAGRRTILHIVYDAGVTFSWMHLVIPGVLALILWGLLSGPLDLRTPRTALVNLELLIPMLAGLLISDTITREWADETAGWRLTQPGGPSRLLIIRLFNTLVLWIVIAGTFLAAVKMLYLDPAELTLPWQDAIILLGPPALFFTGLGFLSSLLARMSLGGLLATAGYWAFTWISGGTYTGPFHVLYLREPLGAWTFEATRWWLLVGGLLLLAVGSLIFRKGERWVR